MKAFLYARVSTDDQDAEMQLREMRDLAERRGCEIEEFTDVGISGAEPRRPGLDQMMALVRRGKCDLVVVYRFDRFARSTRHLVQALEEFRTMGVEFVSVHEQIDTTSMTGKLVFTMIAGIAEFERELIRQRTLSGIARARARGRKFGRPRRELDMRHITPLRALGQPWRTIARELRTSKSTLLRFMRKHGVKSVSEDQPAAPIENRPIAGEPDGVKSDRF